jgi:peptidoglycan/xylan/chitin deacetylase (PgdA/CDA1 family)
MPVDTYPNTGSEPNPSYIPNDVIVPTLHDGPTGDALTDAKLAYLDANGLHWDFFLNTNNWCDITTAGANPNCESEVVDILQKHNPTNHTVHHWHLGTAGSMGCADATCVESELTGVETVIDRLSMGARTHLTRIRPPFGELGPGSYVAPTIAKYGIAIGENVDSLDWNAPAGATGVDIANTIIGLIGTPGSGQYGVMGMHVFVAATTDAMPILFDPKNGYLAKNKFRVGTVEDVICWKYGKHSWEIVGNGRGPN